MPCKILTTLVARNYAKINTILNNIIHIKPLLNLNPFEVILVGLSSVRVYARRRLQLLDVRTDHVQASLHPDLLAWPGYLA